MTQPPNILILMTDQGVQPKYVQKYATGAAGAARCYSGGDNAGESMFSCVLDHPRP